eukprot:TRINITY_DN5367_c0_g1_i1.p1 TRINITY_DN5367_c0_g1~~TRINITY_DN5367_c0_g1_i1.p1  ORF type:complete len:134 (+),score=32.15 TRINITY_DN5367_c0_g1_i1:1174-1575(+)
MVAFAPVACCHVDLILWIVVDRWLEWLLLLLLPVAMLILFFGLLLIVDWNGCSCFGCLFILWIVDRWLEWLFSFWCLTVWMIGCWHEGRLVDAGEEWLFPFYVLMLVSFVFLLVYFRGGVHLTANGVNLWCCV